MKCKTNPFGNENKFEVLEWLLEDDDLCRCLNYNEKNFLEKPMNDNIKSELVGTHLFPCWFIPETVTEKGSFITLKFDYEPMRYNDFILVGNVVVTCFCSADPHVFLLDYDTRQDFMKRKVCDILGDRFSEDGTWLGKLSLQEAREVNVDFVRKYIGISLLFSSHLAKLRQE